VLHFAQLKLTEFDFFQFAVVCLRSKQFVYEGANASVFDSKLSGHLFVVEWFFRIALEDVENFAAKVFFEIARFASLFFQA